MKRKKTIRNTKTPSSSWFVNQSLPNLLLQTLDGLQMIMPFKVVRKSRWTTDVFSLTNFRSAGPQKLYPNYHACLAVRHVEKFREVTSYGPKVIGALTLNFKQIFECSLLKIVGEPPSPMVCALASFRNSLAHVKFEGRRDRMGQSPPSKFQLLGKFSSRKNTQFGARSLQLWENSRTKLKFRTPILSLQLSVGKLQLPQSISQPF